MADPTPAIELRELSKSFGNTKVLNDLTLRIDQGVFLTLLGPSGCGKSTVLRLIAGFMPPSKGKVLVDGQDITRTPAHSRPVKMVFQDYALFPHMNIATNIGFGCEMLGMPRDRIARRSAELLDLIRLPEIADRYPDELSGGQRQRVALARALAPDPAALLLDEPLGALDLRLRRQMQQELRTIQRTTGKTFVFVTHDQEEAMSMSDIIVVMNGGRIEQIDTPEVIYQRPASAFVASFVGSANLAVAKVHSRDAQALTLDLYGKRWRVPLDRVTSPLTPDEGDMATVVMRPDAFCIGAGTNGDLQLSGRLAERTYLGSRQNLELHLTSGEVVQIELSATQSASEGETLDVHCNTDRVAILAGTTEQT